MNNINPKDIPDDIPHRKEWIKYQLLIRGCTLTDLANKEGVGNQQPTKALAASYPKWEYIISKELGTTPQLLWPERYDKYGVPLRDKRGITSKYHFLGNSQPNNNTKNTSYIVKNQGGGKHG